MFYLVLTFILIIIINYKVNNRRLFSSAFLIIGPYIVIVALNNIYFTKIGFIRISTRTCLFLSITMILFCIGDMLGQYCCSKVKKTNINLICNKEELNKKNIKWILLYVALVCLFGVVEIVVKFRYYGYSGMIANDFKHFARTGLSAHLFLSIKPLCAILFCYWIKNKKEIYPIFMVILAGILTASSFIKYHIITYVLLLYIYTCFCYPKLFIKYGIRVIGLVLVMFIGNYAVSFSMRSSSVDSSFYLYHIWQYIGGSVINLNYIISNPLEYMLSLPQWLSSILLPFPAMFILKLIPGLKFSYFQMDMLPITTMPAKYSNVTSMIGYILCQPFTVFSIIVIIIWGVISGFILKKAINCNNRIFISFASVYMTYNILSFFSTFFLLAAPWEELIISVIIVAAFTKINFSNEISNLIGRS